MATLSFLRTLKSQYFSVKPAAFAAVALTLAACQTQEAMPVDPETDQGQQSSIAQPLVKKASAKKPTSSALEASMSDASAEEEYSDLWDRIRDGFQLQAAYSHPSVRKQIEEHTKNQQLFDLVSLRASPFLYFIVEEIEARGLPMELALLPIVESTYNPNAYSPDHAVGLWQMIGPTAKSYGVQQDWWFDGRRDPLMSTKAALDYLEFLYGNFGNDWLVAIGAYNTGGGNMRRAMRRGDQSYEELDFWSLPVALETRSLVPKLLALAAIVNDIGNHEIELPVIDNQAALEAVELPNQIDIAQAAQFLEIDYDELKNLNPGYLRWATHPDWPRSLMIPMAEADSFRQQIAALPPSSLITWDRYQIKSGDTLSGIASKLGTQTDVLMHINGLNSSRIIVGNSLLIPSNIDSLSQLNDFDSKVRPLIDGAISVPTRYTIRSGDNLWSIARKFDLRSVEIAKWNDFEIDAILRPGQVIDLSFAQNLAALESDEAEVAEASTDFYRVSRGDTIEKIAKRFKRNANDLLSWNNLSKTEIIYPGQEIRLTPTDTGIN